MGEVEAQDKWDAMEAAQIVCVPSRNESFGRVFVEAWSKGKPVIGARIPAVEEVIRDGITGLLVEPGSAPSLASALERLLRDRELAARLGEQGRRAAATEFSWARVVARVENAYAAAVEARSHK
jgi:glycosyltransferase involved in cell wall biosynthesis